MDLLNIDHLAVTIGDKPVLTDVGLSVAASEIVGLLGPNGAGKSTTIAAALGLLPRHGGTVSVLGQDPRTAPTSVYRDLGVMPEQNGFYDWMSGEEYLAFFAELHDAKATPGGMADQLAAVGLAPRRGQTIGTYSRGMRQRLGLARALIGEPQLVILDEPTNGLDPRGRHEVHDLLRGLAARGTGVLMCTHLLDDVEKLCRRVAVIANGQTLAEGTIADLAGTSEAKDRYRLRLAAPPPDAAPVDGLLRVEQETDTWLVDLDPGAHADVVWKRLFDGGWQITEIRNEGRGLEALLILPRKSGRGQAAMRSMSAGDR